MPGAKLIDQSMMHRSAAENMRSMMDQFRGLVESSADTINDPEGKMIWRRLIDRTKIDPWFKDNIWPLIAKNYKDGTLTIPMMRRFLTAERADMGSMDPNATKVPPSRPQNPAATTGPASGLPFAKLLEPPPVPAKDFKVSTADPEDWTKWKINIDDYPYDPKGIYSKLNTDVFNGTLPDIPVHWGDTEGGFASTNARVSCEVDKITNKLIRTNEACTLANDPRMEMIITDFSNEVHDPHWHAQLISTILHEACHAYMYTHGKVQEDHGPNFRALLYTAANRTGIDYNKSLGSWQPDMYEDYMDIRRMLRIIEQVDLQMSEADNETDGLADAEEDPLADLRNPDGTITIKSHGYPTGDDITAMIDAFRSKMGSSGVS